jgi:hypothetical protein
VNLQRFCFKVIATCDIYFDTLESEPHEKLRKILSELELFSKSLLFWCIRDDFSQLIKDFIRDKKLKIEFFEPSRCFVFSK